MPFSVSSPLLDLLTASNADPVRVNSVIDRRLARGEDARMRPSDYYPALLRRKTGMPVVGISRASNHLLVEIESRTSLWSYLERSRNNCSLFIAAKVPETLKIALIGRPASALVLTAGIIDNLKIDRVSDYGGGTMAYLRPGWRRYQT